MRVYQGKVIGLWREKKRLPDGRAVSLDIVRHPGAVLIIPFLAPGKIIFLKQFRPVLGRAIFELPAGTLKKNEPPRACARRELIEETGYAAGRWRFLGSIFPVPGYSTEEIRIYAASGLRRSYLPADEDEVIRPQVFSKSRVKRLFRQGKIRDAKTIAALAFCGWL